MREKIVTILNQIALILEIKGENAFKIRAYKNGSEIIENYGDDIIQITKDGKLGELKGIGKALASKIEEIVETGKLTYLDELKLEFPDTFFDLFEISNLGPKKIKKLYDNLQIDSIDKLEASCKNDEISKISGFGKKSVEAILESISFRKSNSKFFRIGDIAPIAESILEFLRQLPQTSQAEIAGSYRRGKEIVHDIDFIVATKLPVEIINEFTKMPEVAQVISKGKTKSSVRLNNGLQCDLRAVKNSEFPFALNYFTGSKAHNVKMRSLAIKNGYSLNEYALNSKTKTNEDVINDESDLYKALGLSFIHPALREDQGEVEAAKDASLPNLIQIENLKGTFHNHTTASDGKNSLSEMAEAATDLGLQYLGISDHSKSSVQANGLSDEELLQQVKEIKDFNDRNNNELTIFSGVECDILKDGSLDYNESVLSQLDYCIASVHSSFSLTENEMTQRVIKAIESPNVTMIGHLTGRLLLLRKPYDINVSKIIDACAKNNTIIEINANPRRLDMDWRWWKKAKDKGVKCSINPDAHKIEHFQYLHFGVKIAQKGWLESSDVVNCLPIDEIKKLLKQKSR
ncbi:MAG: DNA polymerase/3'-5' exonuclease PolX [Verrucomicrobiota bacterium]|nr:DNA polymerase/3'-5' exonuclease PolX [Verrucomicrobiota bacterium]